MTTSTRRLIHTLFFPPIAGALSAILYVLANDVARGSLDVGGSLIGQPLVVIRVSVIGIFAWIIPGAILWIVFEHTPLRSRQWAERAWAFLLIGALYGLGLSLLLVAFVHPPVGRPAGRNDIIAMIPWICFVTGLTAGWCNRRITRSHVDAGGEEYGARYLHRAPGDRNRPI